jgi:hypothetical protein
MIIQVYYWWDNEAEEIAQTIEEIDVQRILVGKQLGDRALR